ncbi:hypothetical protein BVRB_022760 [Beta vulgaris subsp. vulgaris]|uniref:Uncharacterized protein n=1 Tax=Beta vulgaris subsp. vulgaris TaxID=3555 RepID=A0A0J8B367_BETVV|nr:hypothetical protein BVRB_022760 [Beta vulgaris subsp. vulgaris]
MCIYLISIADRLIPVHNTANIITVLVKYDDCMVANGVFESWQNRVEHSSLAYMTKQHGTKNSKKNAIRPITETVL